ncbi:GDP-fucose protein O-fucosyltransferase 2-like isoform X1 [Daphnia pulex]|uniref:GDP-fucose protein O-fucosyltransferase 2-like isoform X1 n=1 Tax=Daphnia pulex TaxID=6669 RepID=UPI001EDE43F4|nr:GDP-fucose protein O-fucosyltransferase 2-like isoform X1 [Daphnia pulex]
MTVNAKLFRFSLFWFVVLFGNSGKLFGSQVCDRGEVFDRNYLLYDLNPAEGFNLRRDVFIRLAVFVKRLQQHGDWVLVLPPWGPLPHWKSNDIGDQFKLPWKLFFNTESLIKYVSITELSDLLSEKKNLLINQLFYLQHFQDGWESGKWEEKYKFENCINKLPYRETKDGAIKGWFWGYEKIEVRNISCVSFQGHFRKLLPILSQHSKKSGDIIMIDRGEIPLHDDYGGVEYWKVRRSMRYSFKLYALASQFRLEFLQSDDETDRTSLPSDWRDEVPGVVAKGGDYVCGHLRRQDFLYGRSNDVPSLKLAAKKLAKTATLLNLRNIFVASDGTKKEMEELRSYLSPKYQLFLYLPSFEVRKEILDGGVAIVEQIICSRARHFIGSFESTFSFRIQEEREILGFPSNSTFNRFCADDNDSCEQPAKWKKIM